MDHAQSCDSVLPEELVGRIIAMVPFPSIFKARTLSRSWWARFAPIASLDDEVEKRHATLFQKQVSERSQNWETSFSIVFDKKLSLAFDWASGNLSRLPSLAFLPRKFQVSMSNPDIEGPLIYGCVPSNQLIYVANILTRSWKELPPRLDAGDSNLFCWKKLVIGPSLQTYKVIVFYHCPADIDDGYSVHIYDSKSLAWTSKRLVVSKHFKTFSPPVVLNGVLYMVAHHDLQNLVAFDVEEETSREIRLSFTDGLSITGVTSLAVCNANLLMVASEGVSLHVLKIDLKSRQLFEVARGNLAAFNLSGFITRQPINDGENILFWINFPRTFQCSMNEMRMVAYNVKQDQWRCFAFPYRMRLEFQDIFITYEDYVWSAVSFQPGLNPFLAV